MSKLGSVFMIQNMEVNNRFLRSATMEYMADMEGFVTDDLIRLYYDLALGGAGLVITGACAVEENGRVWSHQTSVSDDKYIEGLGKLAQVMHEYGDGCKCAVQLHHGGTAGYGYSYGAKDTGYSLVDASEREIGGSIKAFGEAALRVQKAGFDAIAVHGAHGYLISQFLSPLTNKRVDSWGGSPEKRVRFALEICNSIRERVGDDVPLLWKMNSADYLEGGQGIGEYTKMAEKLVKAGVDLIELSGGVKDQIRLRVRLKKEAGKKEAYFRGAIKPFREAIGDKALAVTGGIRSLRVMEEVLDEGVDLVGVCRPLISEPDLPKRLLHTPDKRPARCTSCSKCLIRIGRQPVKCEEFDEMQRIIKDLSRPTVR